MKKLMDNGEQMSLDFDSAVVRIEHMGSNKSKVVNFSSFVHLRMPQEKSPPVLDRLLQEAQKLRW